MYIYKVPTALLPAVARGGMAFIVPVADSEVRMCACMYVCMYVYMYEGGYVYVYMYMCI
jgi:hypothetical protein